MNKQLQEREEYNMRFEYNGNLLEEDRIHLVAKEIIDKDPQISIEKAQKAARGKYGGNHSGAARRTPSDLR